MADRVVVKDNWVDATTDQISQFGWTIVGWFVLGGMATTGIGMASGYMATPQGQDPAPQMMEHTAEAHRATWSFIVSTVDSTWQAIQDARPEA
jgi:hypothetical protein